MEDVIIISNLNDFVFCPASIYFHGLYGSSDKMLYQGKEQLNGSKAHEAVDQGNYSTKKTVITSLDVYSETYGIVGKIDQYDADKKLLTERKKHIVRIYDGYVYQIYAQYFALEEMGYEVNRLQFYSMDDNKKYPIPLPKDNQEMLQKFETVVNEMRTFKLETFVQTNVEKCNHCIYEQACDRAANRESGLC